MAMRLAERGVFAWLPPILAFLLVNSVFGLAAAIDGYNYFDPWTWAHWDSFHYLDIARHGYTLSGCIDITWWDPLSVTTAFLDTLGFAVEPTQWCGTAGWFPGFPIVLKFVSFTGLSPVASGVAIAVVAQLATLIVLWRWFLLPMSRSHALIALGAATFFFGHIYYRAVFPMSMTTLLLLVYLRMLESQRWQLAGLAGAAAAFTYPTIFVIAPVTIAWLLLARPDLTRRATLIAGAFSAGGILLGFVAVQILQWNQTGIWGGFFKVQSQFNYGINLPTERLFDVVRPILDTGLELGAVPRLHTGLAAITVVSISSVCFIKRNHLRPTESWAILATIALWLFPLTLGGQASLYRIESVLIPVVIVLPRMPTWFRYMLTAALVAMSYPMAILFYRNVLI
jgi:hypothetical protein